MKLTSAVAPLKLRIFAKNTVIPCQSITSERSKVNMVHCDKNNFLLIKLALLGEILSHIKSIKIFIHKMIGFSVDFLFYFRKPVILPEQTF